MGQGFYIDLWTSQRKTIREKLERVGASRASIQLNKDDFEDAGKRLKSGYGFNLEFKNGKVINNIGGSAVARDLAAVLTNDSTIKKILATGSFKINMGKDFCLYIQKI